MRLANRIGTLVLGVVLLAAGLLLAAEAALAAAGRSPWLLPLDRWYDRLSATTAADGWFLAAAVAVGVLGLLVLVWQLRPWPPQYVAAGPGPGGWRVARRSVEQRVAAAAAALGGVHQPQASIRGSENRWRLRLTALADRDLQPAVGTAIRTELQTLGAVEVPVNVVLRRGRVT
jgi:hypothetical protein